MSDLKIVHLEHDGTTIETIEPENLRFTLNKGENGPHDISYEMSRSAITAPDQVGPYRTDFKLVDMEESGITIMAGLHTMVSVASDQEMAQFAGKDWLHYLERRNWPVSPPGLHFHRVTHGDPDTDPPEGFGYFVAGGYFPQDSMVIIGEVLDEVLGEPNSLTFSYDLTPIGYEPAMFSINLVDASTILSKIQELSQDEGGEFDFWVDPDTREFTVVHPRQYDIDVVDDESLAVHTFDTTVPASGIFTVAWTNTGPTETRLVGTGAIQSDSLTAVREYVPASEVFRLLESQANYGDVLDADVLSRRIRKQLLFEVNPVHEVTLSVLPESVTDFWATFKPGKAIWIRAPLEVHGIDAAFEIVSMDGETDSNGNVLVNFRLNQIYSAVDLDT